MFTKIPKKIASSARKAKYKVTDNLRDLNLNLKTRIHDEYPFHIRNGYDIDDGPWSEVDRELFWSEILSEKFPKNKFLKSLATKQDRAFLLKEMLEQRKRLQEIRAMRQNDDYFF